MSRVANIINPKETAKVVVQALVILVVVVLSGRVRVGAQNCPPKALPYYEDFDNDEWEHYYLTSPIFTDNCWRENFNDHAGSIANSQDDHFPDNPPGNSACCGSRYVGPPGSPATNYGWVTILVSPELESPPTSVSFSIFSYGIYAQFYVGDSLRKRLAVGYITDTNDLKGSFVGVDTVELCAERVVWERFTVTGFENMPPPYFVAFWNDSLLQYPAWSLLNQGFTPQSIDYRFYIDSVLFDGVPIDPDPDPDPDPDDPNPNPEPEPEPDDPPVIPEPDTVTSVRLYLPNAFTPGGNALNPEFLPVFSNPEEIEYYRMEIYDRWGGLIFRTEDLTRGWDGDHKPEGVYVVLVCYKPRGLKERYMKGSVTLIR